ncbi:MAG: 5-(carboxyamino)imidazole ribonucleotide mutase [Deltaproteobacteria bacterium]|nr:5-(carboxyamino)imidazole ribonucleotide mutase [Deltaproteobacteria bacterium]
MPPEPEALPHPSSTEPPRVGVIMGSESDHGVLLEAEQVLRELGIPFEVAVVSAHRTPERMVAYARSAEARGLAVIIAAAGGAAHLPGMVSALTVLPVLGVPVPSKALAGVDSLLSIVQMPAGVPTATFAIGTAGAVNAALFAAQILAVSDASLRAKLGARREALAAAALEGHARVVEAIARSAESR